MNESTDGISIALRSLLEGALLSSILIISAFTTGELIHTAFAKPPIHSGIHTSGIFTATKKDTKSTEHLQVSTHNTRSVNTQTGSHIERETTPSEPNQCVEQDTGYKECPIPPTPPFVTAGS